MEDFLAYQRTCPVDHSSFCDHCSFFLGCEKKYELKKDDREIYIETSKNIMLFPSLESFLEFKQIFNYEGDYELLKLEEIENISECQNKDIIVFS